MKNDDDKLGKFAIFQNADGEVRVATRFENDEEFPSAGHGHLRDGGVKVTLTGQ